MIHPDLKRFAIQLESIDEAAWDALQEDYEEYPEMSSEEMVGICTQVLIVAYQVAESEEEALHLAAMACGFNDEAQWWWFFNAGDQSYELVAVDASDEEPWETWDYC
jgi:hypothetical protein